MLNSVPRYIVFGANKIPSINQLYLQIIFTSFLFLFELGSLICAVATSSKMFIGGRAVSGMGAAGIMNGGLTILSACVPLEKRPGKHSYNFAIHTCANIGVLKYILER
jgi:MFS family permease